MRKAQFTEDRESRHRRLGRGASVRSMPWITDGKGDDGN
jgi:hypothetical protein